MSSSEKTNEGPLNTPSPNFSPEFNPYRSPNQNQPSLPRLAAESSVLQLETNLTEAEEQHGLVEYTQPYSEKDEPTHQSLTFSFQNDGARPLQERSTSSLQFLQEVSNLQSGESQSSRVVTDRSEGQSKEESKGSHRSVASLQVIHEDALEMYGTETYTSNYVSGPPSRTLSERGKLQSFGNEQEEEKLQRNLEGPSSAVSGSNRAITAFVPSALPDPSGQPRAEQPSSAVVLESQGASNEASKPPHANSTSHRTDSGSGVSSTSQDYVKIFENLLGKALQQQNELLQLLQTRDLDMDYTQFLIDPYLTKSFKDLCARLLDQNTLMHALNGQLQTEMGQLQQYCQTQLQSQAEAAKKQLEELFQSQIEEAQIQEKIHEAKLRDLQASHDKEVAESRELHELKAKKQEEGHQAALGSLRAEIKKLEESNEAWSKRVKGLEKERDDAKESANNQKDYLASMSSMYNLLKQNQAQKLSEVEDLKAKFEKQIEKSKEHQAELEEKVRGKERECRRLAEQAEEAKKKLETHLSECAEREAQQKAVAQVQPDTSPLHVDIVRAMEEQLQELSHANEAIRMEVAKRSDEVQVLKEQLMQWEAASELLKKQEQEMFQRAVDAEHQNQVLAARLKECTDEARLLAKVDLQFVVSNHTVCAPHLPDKSLFKLQRQRSQARPFGRAQVPYQAEQSALFPAVFQGVSTYAQAVGQAQMIEKFLKMDREQKKEMKAAKVMMAEIEQENSKHQLEIQKIQEDKAALEQLILEILSFGEQCDKQFDQLQLSFKKFEATDRSETEKQLKQLAKMKTALTEQVKQIIVDIDDHQLRDELLKILTKMGQRAIDLDVANQAILNALLKRVMEALQRCKEKELVIEQQAITDLKLRDQEALTAELEKRLQGAFEEQDRASALLQKACLQVKDINRCAREYELMLDNRRMVEQPSNLAAEPKSGKEAKPSSVEEIAESLFSEISLLGDWTQEQRRDIPRILQDRERIIELNLKINNLVQENSLLMVQLDKHKLISEKYKQSIRFSMSPILEQRSPSQPRRETRQESSREQKEQLRKILDQVRHLKQECAPERPGQVSVEHSAASVRSRGSSYFDEKGHFDLINRQSERKQPSFRPERFEVAGQRKPLPTLPAAEGLQEQLMHMQRSGSVIELDQTSGNSIFDRDKHRVPRSRTPLQADNTRGQLSSTVQQEQFQRYRHSTESRESDLGGQDHHQPPLANTHTVQIQTNERDKKRSLRGSLSRRRASHRVTEPSILHKPNNTTMTAGSSVEQRPAHRQGRRRLSSTRGSQAGSENGAVDLPLQIGSKRGPKQPHAYQPVRQEMLRYHSTTEMQPAQHLPESSLSRYPPGHEGYPQHPHQQHDYAYSSVNPAMNSQSHLGLFPQKLESLNNSANSSTGEKRRKSKTKKSKMSTRKVAKKTRAKRKASPGDQASLADSLEEDNTFEREQTKKQDKIKKINELLTAQNHLLALNGHPSAQITARQTTHQSVSNQHTSRQHTHRGSTGLAPFHGMRNVESHQVIPIRSKEQQHSDHLLRFQQPGMRQYSQSQFSTQNILSQQRSSAFGNAEAAGSRDLFEPTSKYGRAYALNSQSGHVLHRKPSDRA